MGARTRCSCTARGAERPPTARFVCLQEHVGRIGERGQRRPEVARRDSHAARMRCHGNSGLPSSNAAFCNGGPTSIPEWAPSRRSPALHRPDAFTGQFPDRRPGRICPRRVPTARRPEGTPIFVFGESFSCQIWLFGLICSSKPKLDRFMSVPTVAHCPPLADPDLAPEARRAARVWQAERGRRIVSRLKADNARGRASSRARSMTAPGPGQRPGLPAKRGRRARLDPRAVGRVGSNSESKMAPHLLENTRNRIENGRPHAELDPGIRMRFLSWRPGLSVAAGRNCQAGALRPAPPPPCHRAFLRTPVCRRAMAWSPSPALTRRGGKAPPRLLPLQR